MPRAQHGRRRARRRVLALALHIVAARDDTRLLRVRVRVRRDDTRLLRIRVRVRVRARVRVG